MPPGPVLGLAEMLWDGVHTVWHPFDGSRDLPGDEALSKPLWQVFLEACRWFLELLDGFCYFLLASIWLLLLRGDSLGVCGWWQSIPGASWMVASISWETYAPGVTDDREIVNPTSGTKMTKKGTRTCRRRWEKVRCSCRYKPGNST